MAKLLRAFEYKIEKITLLPADGGRFEVTVNGKLIYSKLKTSRYPELSEVLDLVRELT